MKDLIQIKRITYNLYKSEKSFNEKTDWRMISGLVITTFIFTALNVHIIYSQSIQYPVTKQVDHTDDYHGKLVKDPFRWLESTDSPETKIWIDSQNDISKNYLDSLAWRTHFLERYNELQEIPSPFVPRRQWSYWISQSISGDETMSYVMMDSLGGVETTILTPKVLFPNEKMNVSHVRISPDGRYVLYAVSPFGKREMDVKVRDIHADEDLKDEIPGIKFNAPYWTADSKGFVYYKYMNIDDDGVDRESKVFYHKLGTPLEQDQILAESDPEEIGATTWSRVSQDGRFIYIYDEKAGLHQITFIDLQNPLNPDFDNPPTALNNSRDGSNEIFGSSGDTLYIKTTRNAPNGKIVAVSIQDPKNWQVVIPESEDVLQHVKLIGHHIIAAYRQDVKSVLKIFGTDGSFYRDIELPAIGSVFYLQGDSEKATLQFSFDSYTFPLTNFNYDLSNHKLTKTASRDIGHNPSEFITRQVFFKSKDGTTVPMFVTHKRGIQMNGNNPALLYGYGAGGIEEPIFRDDWFIWIESGGILAVANVRGGEEYGTSWEQAGRKQNKQNSYDDFISAAETLIAERYTSNKHLAVHGVSNGGWLVGGVMTQRPDLFAAAVPGVGVLDLLRFAQFTAGARWIHSNGNPNDPEEFEWLYPLSPLHRIKNNVCYPATLVITAINDDLVHPSQSFKFTAALQHAQSCDQPVLIRTYTKGAHSVGYLPDTMADIFAFLMQNIK